MGNTQAEKNSATSWQIGVTVLIAASTLFLLLVSGPGIDWEKHRPQDEPSVIDISLSFIPFAASLAGTVLLSAKRQAGWWISVVVNLAGLVVFGVITLDVAVNVRTTDLLSTLLLYAVFISLFSITLWKLIEQRLRSRHTSNLRAAS